MGKRLQDLLHHLSGVRSYGLRPLDHAGGRPVQVSTMGLGPMLGMCYRGIGLTHARVGSDSSPLVEDLDGSRRGAHFHRLMDQWIGNAIEAAIELNVVVDVDRSLGP